MLGCATESFCNRSCECSECGTRLQFALVDHGWPNHTFCDARCRDRFVSSKAEEYQSSSLSPTQSNEPSPKINTELPSFVLPSPVQVTFVHPGYYVVDVTNTGAVEFRKVTPGTPVDVIMEDAQAIRRLKMTIAGKDIIISKLKNALNKPVTTSALEAAAEQLFMFVAGLDLRYHPREEQNEKLRLTAKLHDILRKLNPKRGGK